MVLYILAYSWIQHRRDRKGPWEVTFSTTNGAPTIVINQPWLGLTNVTLVFAGETGASITNSERVTFRNPKQTPFRMSFAECVFEDLTFLPGTVTLRAYKHEIELLPRTLVIDQKETEWKSGAAIKIVTDTTKTSPGAP